MKFTKIIIILGIIFSGFLNSQITFCQDSLECTLIKEYKNGCYLVQIDNKKYLAVTEKIEREMLKMKRDLLDAEKEIVLKESLMVNYDQTIAWYDTTLKNMKAYITELEDVLNGYKELLRDYKKLKEPWFTFKGGIGATGEKYKPAVLMGLGIRQFSVWGILQERNSGVIIGKQFRLY